MFPSLVLLLISFVLFLFLFWVALSVPARGARRRTHNAGEADGNATATLFLHPWLVMTASRLQEVVIGTHDSCDASGVLPATSAWKDHLPDPPTLAEVEAHVASLRALVENGNAFIEATALQLIETIVDRLDQVYYWAVEEGTTFLNEPSQLAQCGVPELTLLCVATRRPRIVGAALRIMRHLLRHRQAASYLMASATMNKEKQKTSLTHTEDDNLFGILASVMRQHAGLSELQAEVAAVATEAALLDIDGLLESTIISHVLAALERHGSSTAMQREGVWMFSTLVDIPCGDAPGKDDAGNDVVPRTPIAVLLSQCGVVVRFVVDVVKSHSTNVEVKRNAVHFFLRCASYPENREVLLQEGVYPVLVDALPSAVRIPELFAEVTEAIASFIPLLDPLQQRSLVLVVRRVLLKTSSPVFVSLCVALLVRILQLGPRGDLMPCQGMQPGVSEETAPNRCLRGGELTRSDTIRLGEGDIRVFMTSHFIPQLLCCAADTIGEDDAVLRRVVADAVGLLAPYRWR
ncbi:hypothetical protein TRSC58_01564 [Trypanosoma rangeli SC58]|uniref:Uncharacterized protein n=1 Tax=Trypanosoma rangeli SC58 TaxID=429131 RepID=A0A061J5I6_TRYRA|nr:hypothetical protein TRSC58_01564 [Trypanosoma rangeli SC58]